MQRSLTDAYIRCVPTPENGRLEIADQKCSGLAFRVTAAGVRSWCFRFRDPRTRKTTRGTIGRYPTISLQEARQRADELRRQVANGLNPVEQKRRDQQDATQKSFRTLADRYMNEYARRHKRSAEADERNLRLHVLPKWANRLYDEIRRADIIELVERLVTDGKPTLANRVQALISSIFSFAVDSDLINGNPCARLKKRGSETIGRRVLTDQELRIFWPGIILPPVSQRVGFALRLILLTGARPGEIAGIRLNEFEALDDAANAKWILPAERSKNGRSNLIPLSDIARATVLTAIEISDKNKTFLFPSPVKENHSITAHSLAVAMSRFADSLSINIGATWRDEPPTPHDLRRTLATRLAALGVPKEDRDAVLNHTPRDVGKKHYDLYDREKEKRIALDRWAQSLVAILDNSTLPESAN